MTTYCYNKTKNRAEKNVKMKVLKKVKFESCGSKGVD